MTADPAVAALAEVDRTILSIAAHLRSDPDDRQDLAQVGRLAAWQAHTSFDGTGRLEAWMCGKARWAMIDWLRTNGPCRRGGQQRPDLVAWYGVADPADPSPGPEQVACARAEAAEVGEWLASLPARTADAFTMPPVEWAARYGRDRSRASQIRHQALEARAA